MIRSPAFSPNHPDKGIDCEMVAEDEFRALAQRIESAGWSGAEAASALSSLALNYVLQRRANSETDKTIAVARKKASH